MRLVARLRRLARGWDYLFDHAPARPAARRGVLGMEALEARDVPAGIALDDTYATHTGKVIDQAAPGVLGNDTGTGKTVTGWTQPVDATSGADIAGDSLFMNSYGRVQYKPARGFVGDVTFQYTAAANGGETGTGTVTIHVTNAPATATQTAVAYSTPTNTTLRVGTPGLIAAGSDADGDTLQPVGVDQDLTPAANGDGYFTPGGGHQWLSWTGSFVYKPPVQPTGSPPAADSFRFTLWDGQVDASGNKVTSEPITVTINGGITLSPFDAAYNQYLAGARQAYAEYTADEAAARSTLDAVGDSADAALLAALNTAMADATAAVAALQTSADATTDQAWSAFLAAYDTAYNTFSAAWDAANNNLAALQQAVADFNAAVDVVYDQYEAAFGAAVAAAQSNITGVQSALDAATAAADQAWDAATDAALAAYTSAEQVAWANYTSAEQADWNAYLAAEPGQPQLRQQQPPAQAPGPRVKPTPPPLFKLTPSPGGNKMKIEGPTLNIELNFLPFKPTLKIEPAFDVTPFPKPGKPVVDPILQFRLEFKIGPKPPR